MLVRARRAEADRQARRRRRDQHGRPGNGHRGQGQAGDAEVAEFRDLVITHLSIRRAGLRVHLQDRQAFVSACKPADRAESYIREVESPPSSGWSGKHAVELYVRTYTTMLQSSGEIKVESLVQAHLGMGSVLHPLAAEPQVGHGRVDLCGPAPSRGDQPLPPGRDGPESSGIPRRAARRHPVLAGGQGAGPAPALVPRRQEHARGPHRLSF